MSKHRETKNWIKIIFKKCRFGYIWKAQIIYHIYASHIRTLNFTALNLSTK